MLLGHWSAPSSERVQHVGGRVDDAEGSQIGFKRRPGDRALARGLVTEHGV
jgi:hypothetical protein